MLHAADIREMRVMKEALKDKVHPDVMKAIIMVAEEQFEQRKMIREFAQHLDQMANIISAQVVTMGGMQSMLKKFDKTLPDNVHSVDPSGD